MTQSEVLFSRAQNVIPGGVNSPVRAFKAVGGTPLFITSAKGATLTDVDGRLYIDYVGSWGPMIAGHAHPRVVDAICRAASKGSSFGAPTEAEVLLAEKIIQLVPSIAMVRLVNSGTEATMSALRLARGVTGRNLVVKFAGCYHGHADAFLVAAGSGAATLGQPSSPGVPADTVKDTLILPYNDLAAATDLFAQQGNNIAALIIEPVAGNIGCVLPRAGFLQGLRQLCTQYGALLIFDEVMTGFRVAKGGAQERFNIQPDLTTLGKIIGGGLPVGAYGGRRDIMEHISPAGPIYQAGTLSGNPLATAAGLATLEILCEPGFYEYIENHTKLLIEGLTNILVRSGIPHVATHIGSMFSIFFTKLTEIRNYEDVKLCDTKRFNAWFHSMLQEGVYLAPSQFEACFLSYSHSDEVIIKTLEAAHKSVCNIS